MSEQRETDALFMGLALNIHSTALQYMGKMANPIDGTIDRNLAAAKQTIDLLVSLERKTQGNLSEEEEKTFREMITHLRLNFVEESKQGEGTTADADDGEAAEAASAEGDDAKAGD